MKLNIFLNKKSIISKKVVFSVLIFAFFLSSCSVHRGNNLVESIRQGYYPYKVKPYVNPGWTQYGTASWYGPDFHGKKTADGEIYDMYAKTAAHKTLPFNTYVRVTNLNNHRDTVVRINDRGPFVGNRVIDLSYAAAKDLGMIGTGTAPVKITVLSSNGPNSTNAQTSNENVSEKIDINENIGAGSSNVMSKKALYTVQIGSFRSLANALRFKDRALRRIGNVYIEKAVISSGVFYRVVVGSFVSKSAALDFADKNVAPIFGDFCIIAK